MKREVEELYREKFSTFVSLMTMKTGCPSSAEDIVQEAFLRTLHFYDKWDSSRGSLATWVSTILNNCYIDWTEDRLVLSEDQIPEGETEELEETFVIPEMVAALLKKIQEVENLEHRNILELTLVQGFKDRDAADIVGCTHGKVRKVKHDFRKRMGEVL